VCFLLLGRRRRQLVTIAFFSLLVLLQKRKQQQVVAFSLFSLIYLWVFCCEKSDDNYSCHRLPFYIFFYLKKKVFFYSPFTTKKASSVELTINNDFVVFLNVHDYNG
jgi:hypothetical protein